MYREILKSHKVNGCRARFILSLTITYCKAQSFSWGPIGVLSYELSYGLKSHRVNGVHGTLFSYFLFANGSLEDVHSLGGFIKIDSCD